MTARGSTRRRATASTFSTSLRAASVRSAPNTGEIALSPDGATLAAVRGQQIALLDPERLTVMSVIGEDGAIDGPLTFSPKGDQLGYSVDDSLVVRSLADPDAAVTPNR